MKFQEQVWSLRSSLETTEHDLLHTKRSYLASQQTVVHSERTSEQLRSQLKEMEKNNDRISKSFAGFKEGTKQKEDSAKEIIDKLEMEMKINNSQVKEMFQKKKENENLIQELTKK